MLGMTTWQSAWLVLLIILAGGLVFSKLTERPRIPDVAAYLLLGIIIGPSVLNWVSEPSQSQVNQLILNLGATLILFGGGRSVRFSVLKQVWISVTMLATVGVVVSTVVVGVAAHWLLGIPWLESLLLSGLLSSTDPATLIPIFSRVPILPRLQQTVESESAFNDATAAVLVYTLLGLLQHHGDFHLFQPIGDFFHSALLGLAIGLIFGWLSLLLLSDRGIPVFHEYASVFLLLVALGSYECAQLLNASGMMATFTAGMIAGNGKAIRLPLSNHTEHNVHHFENALTLIMRILIFTLLGTQVNFVLIQRYWLLGLATIAVLMLVARPMTVLASVLFDRRAKWRWREILFMFWVRETGVIPAALSGMLLSKGVPYAPMISSITFIAILLTILLQASTTSILARKLGVSIEFLREDI